MDLPSAILTHITFLALQYSINVPLMLITNGSVKPSKKHKQVFIHRHEVPLVSVIYSDDTNFHQPSLRRVKLHSNLA